MDPRALLGIKLSVSPAAGLLGLVSNSWIVHVNAKDWRRGVHLSLPDQILTFMGLINIVLQAVLSFDMSSIQTKFYSTYSRIHLSCIGLLIFLVSSNVWLTAWLSIYYCMKIVTFSRGILLLCKMRISRFLPKLLVVSTAASFIVALPSLWSIHHVTKKETTGNSTHNNTEEQSSMSMSSPYLIITFLGCIVPLILTLIPIGLTLSSLWRHTKRMKMNRTDSSRPQTQAHVRATRTMVLLVSVHTALLVDSIYVLSNTFNYDQVFMFLCWYFSLFYPMVQALVIITGNSKLRKASKELLSLGVIRCHVFPENRMDLPCLSSHRN